MRYFINNIKASLNEDLDEIKKRVLGNLGLTESDLIVFKLIRKAIDARNKKNIFYINNFFLETKNKKLNLSNDLVLGDLKETIEIKEVKKASRVVIVGFGPAGMFAAHTLAKAGLKPVVLERGKEVEERLKDLNDFEKRKNFNEESNIVFGEGGAGTFSDGKLTTGIKSPYLRYVLKTLIEFGAPEDIYYDYMPHVGTDYLVEVVKNLRKEIISLGGKIIFGAKFIDFEKNGDSFSLQYLKEEKAETISADKLILATGHSARDIFMLLERKKVLLEPKAFAMGFRIEHKRDYINYLQFRESAKVLPPATYKLSTHLKNGRGVFTFCMCPGGNIMMSASEKNEFVINGMSYKDRNGENSNSAILVNVLPSDFYQGSPLDGINYQKIFEKKAFMDNYDLPVQLVKDFVLNKKTNSLADLKPSYSQEYRLAELKNFYPDYLIESVREGIKDFNKLMPGFLNDNAVLSGVETRSSSPVRILRNSSYESSIKNIYPCGEGSGYSGGIMSSAIDGINIAKKIIEDLD